jgi:hypothetical protein
MEVKRMKIEIKKVWGKVRQDRWGVVVRIENRGNIFEYMPTYKDLAQIYCKLVEVEELNKCQSKD